MHDLDPERASVTFLVFDRFGPGGSPRMSATRKSVNRPGSLAYGVRTEVPDHRLGKVPRDTDPQRWETSGKGTPESLRA